MTNSTDRINHPDYHEREALQRLLQAANDSLAEMIDQYEATDNYDYMDGSFTICINGQSIAFLHGGVQHQALMTFIESIAQENGYGIDYERNLVTEE